MYKSTEETMAKQKSHDWRVQQQNFFKNQIVKDVEFVQDQRILNFFSKKDSIYGIGDIDYFKKKFTIVNNIKNCNHCLVIINKKTQDLDLIKILNSTKNFKKICISINKFVLYTESYNSHIIDDYDETIFRLIKKTFIKRDIEHFFVKNLKGSNFNFASPTTQFFIK